MKLFNLRLSLLLAVLLVPAVWVAGCSDDEDGGEALPSGDADVLEAEAEADDAQPTPTADEDQPGPAADEDEDGDAEGPPTTGGISGMVYTTDALSFWNRQILVYDRSPFTGVQTDPIATYSLDEASGQSEVPYQITDLPSAPQYYLMLHIDKNDNGEIEIAQDVFGVYPDPVVVVADDPQLRERTGIDLYVGIQKPEWGGITGDLHLSPAYKDKTLILWAGQRKPNPNDPDAVETWPSSIHYTEAGEVERSFKLQNLTSGDYVVVALAIGDESEPWLVYESPYSPYAINIETGPKTVADEVFYIGVADPARGSISGDITLPKSMEGGTLTLWVISGEEVQPADPAEEPTVQYEPETTLLVQKDNTNVSFPYTIGNLKDQCEVLLLAVFEDAEHQFSSFYSAALWPWPKNISIDFATDATKHHQGLDIDIPITKMTGTLTINHPDFQAPDPTPVWAWAFLADVEFDNEAAPTEILGASAYGGFAEVNFEGTAAGAAYTMFPVKGGAWNYLVVVGTDPEDPINGRWCAPTAGEGSIYIPVDIDGTLFEESSRDITVTDAWLCQDAPQPPAEKK